jgi:hypothetical protein
VKAVAVFKKHSGQNDQSEREHAVRLLGVFERHLNDDVSRIAAAVDHFF